MSDSYRFLITVHILCAVIWVGGGVTLHVLGVRSRKAGTERMKQFVEDASWIGPRFYAPLSVVLLLAGIFLVKNAGYQQSDLFVNLGYVGWLISFVIGVGVYPRIEKRMAAASDDAGYRQGFNLYARVNQVELLILLLVVVDMTIKPGL